MSSSEVDKSTYNFSFQTDMALQMQMLQIVALKNVSVTSFTIIELNAPKRKT